MKIIVAPDKFKGSLTSFEACKSITAGILQAVADAEVHCFPMADGGDGFATVLQHYLQTQTIPCATVDPLGRSLAGIYQWDEKSNIAIIELATASGLVLLQNEERNPLLTSTFGTGLLIKDAIAKGATKIVLGLGGSATNDAGMGILSALGFSFKDKVGAEMDPVGGNLATIEKIISPSLLPDIQFEIACDVQNILFGPQGAAYIYAPQKGASDTDVLLLDKGLQHFHKLIFKQTGKDASNTKGMGAAGGVAAGLAGYFNVTLKRGIDMVVSASHIENALPGADLIITGEGKIDDQSKEGKVIASIAALAKQYNVPAMAFCGSLQLNAAGISVLGLQYASPFINESLSLSESLAHADKLLQQKVATTVAFFGNVSP